MRSLDDERVRVARVRIEQRGRIVEIPACWIAVDAGRTRVGVWLEPTDPEPVVTASLEEISIDWHEVVEMPMPA